MHGLFPEVEPYRSGTLDVGDGQLLYFEECGNPSGRPAVVLHGGPGSGCTPRPRRLFDPDAYRIVLYDQRGAGRSRPRVEAFTPLVANTTHHLVDDLVRLRIHLGIERWVVYGSSWGCTLGLAYAERHSEEVAAMVLSSVTMTRGRDIHWLYHDAGRFYPDAWRRFRDGVPEGERDGDLVAAYHRLLHRHPDPGVRQRAALDWCRWEDAAAPLPDGTANPRYEDPAFRMTFARIVTHYFRQRAWLDDTELLEGAARLAAVPGVLIHGRLDLGGPLEVAEALAAAWPSSELVVVDTGHTGGVAMTDAEVAAIEGFKDR